LEQTIKFLSALIAIEFINVIIVEITIEIAIAIEIAIFVKIDYYINEKYYFRITMAWTGS
jgi:hypothetical protein